MEEFGLFLYDLSTLYELVRLGTDPQYADYYFSQYSLYRRNRPLREQDRLVVDEIRYASPPEILTTLAALGVTLTSAGGAVWVWLQILDRLYNLRQGHRKIELEIQKLEMELQKLDRETVSRHPSDAVAVAKAISETKLDADAEVLIGRVEKRLQQNPVQLEDAEVRVVVPGKDSPRRLMPPME
jgi:hypothetical protein